MKKLLFQVFLSLCTACIGKLFYSWLCKNLRENILFYGGLSMNDSNRDDVFQCVLKLLLKRRQRKLIEKVATLVTTKPECKDYFMSLLPSKEVINHVG